MTSFSNSLKWLAHASSDNVLEKRIVSSLEMLVVRARSGGETWWGSAETFSTWLHHFAECAAPGRNKVRANCAYVCYPPTEIPPHNLTSTGIFCSTSYRDSEEDSRKRPGLLLCLSCRKSSNPHCFATRDKLLAGYQHGFHLSLPCASLFTRHRACAWPDKKSWPGVCVWAVRGSADPQGCSSVEGHLPKSEQLGLQHERQR